MRTTLTRNGYSVVDAANGKVALEKVAEQEFDGIVTDLVMPELDGFGLLSALKERGSKVPVLVMTADIQRSSRARCEDLGARHFLNKPVNDQDLVEKVGVMTTGAAVPVA
jgi:CheY-like chemotaxis protein